MTADTRLTRRARGGAGRPRRSRVEFAIALVVDLLGAAGALLVSGRTWQTVYTPRPRPLADDVLALSGRAIDSASTALALVALAGVVAVLATRGLVRRGIGSVIALAGAAVVWRSLSGIGAVSAAQARMLVVDKHPQVNMSAALVPQVDTHPSWPVLSAVCGLLILLAGAAIAWRGAHWAAMSAKYDAPARQSHADKDKDKDKDGDEAGRQARANVSLWQAIDRGEDPTSQDPSEPPPH